MKSMKSLSMNKMLGSIRKKAGGSSRMPPVSAANPAENPEMTAHNSVKAFCETGGNSKSDEVLFLPPIVDAAESCPAAAAECARIIRKFLSKDYSSKPSWQYNAIMLVRILTDNPGETFTRNLDERFVDTIRALLKNVKDRSVWQLLMETLDDFEYTRMNDQNLAPLVLMWKKEKEVAIKKHGAKGPQPPIPPRPAMFMSPPQLNGGHSQNYFSKSHSNNRLPGPVELASRLEEARTSAKLLEQVVMNTPPGEILQNELIREFVDRCLSASRSLQGYMVSENPAPDNDTMESLIDTNEQLQTALNQQKRATLNARKQLGLGSGGGSNEDSPATQSEHSGNDDEQRPSGTAHSETMAGAIGTGILGGGGGKGKQTESYEPTGSNGVSAGSSSRQSPKDETPKDPFADPEFNKTATYSAATFQPEFSHEPFRPGFGGPQPGGGTESRNGPGNSTSSSYNGPGKLQTPPHDRLQDASNDDDMYEPRPKGKGLVSQGMN